jgi:Holliday junction resolvase-like predicted endonuclease
MAESSGTQKRPRTLPQRRGDTAEQVVADSLARDGWAILGRNIHAGRSELDILAVDPGPPRRLVVGEVRWRASRDFGLPEDTFDWRKRRRLREGLGRLLEAGRLPDGTHLPDLPVGIDLFAVEPPAVEGPLRIRHHRDIGSG